MEINLIAVAIPFFFVLIGIEVLVARWQGRQVFRFADSITDLSCGIHNQVFSIFLKVGLIAVYAAIYEVGAITRLPANSWITWVIAMVGTDLGYYWWHRTSHRVNFVWATHVPHHQSQDYNLAVALRQAWFSSVTSAPFYWPLAILGVPPAVFFASSALNTLYQFWIHTETIRWMGPLEWIINTPSHHRVHHGINPRYIDKNYAGILIIWDRMFGTFEPESEPVVYGTVKSYASWNPAWANLEPWAWMFAEARAIPNWRDRLRLFFAPPEWSAPGRPPLPQPRPVSPTSFAKWDTQTSPGLVSYVLVHFVLAAIAITTLLWVDSVASWPTLGTVSLLILWTTVNWGALFEGRSWGVGSEGVRLGMVGVLALAWGLAIPAHLPGVALLVAVTAISSLWLLRYGPSWAWAEQPMPVVLTTDRASG